MRLADASATLPGSPDPAVPERLPASVVAGPERPAASPSEACARKCLDRLGVVDADVRERFEAFVRAKAEEAGPRAAEWFRAVNDPMNAEVIGYAISEGDIDLSRPGCFFNRLYGETMGGGNPATESGSGETPVPRPTDDVRSTNLSENFGSRVEQGEDFKGLLIDLIGAERVEAAAASLDPAVEAHIRRVRPGASEAEMREYRMTAAILTDGALQAEGRKNAAAKGVDFNAALAGLQRECGDLVPDFRIKPIPVNPDAAPLTKRERSEVRALAGSNADEPMERVGDRYRFKDANGAATVMDASHVPPRIFREHDGLRVEMSGVSDEFSRVHASSLELDRLERELARLQNVDREQLVQGVFRIADEARIDVDDGEAEDPEKLVERIRGELERKRDEAGKGNPPVSIADGDVTAPPVTSFDDLAIEAERTPPDRKAAEGFETRLRKLDELGKRLEENTAAIREAETEHARVRGEMELARAAFDERVRAADEQARENIARLRDAGGDLLGNDGITALMGFLNGKAVRAALGNPEPIDPAKPLGPDQRATFRWGMEALFGDSGLYTPDGDLKPEASEHRDALRARLAERGVLSSDETPDPFEMERVIAEAARRTVSGTSNE